MKDCGSFLFKAVKLKPGTTESSNRNESFNDSVMLLTQTFLGVMLFAMMPFCRRPRKEDVSAKVAF